MPETAPRKKVPFVGGAGTYEGLRCEGPLTHLYYFTFPNDLQGLVHYKLIQQLILAK